MNWITIFGIITIAFGTFLTYYGTSISSSKDKTEITNKIDDFKNDLAKIKNADLPDSQKEKEIEKINFEFQSWADDFLRNKEEKKVLLDKNDLSIREKKILLNTKWREYYVKIFTAIPQMINAYNVASKNNNIKLFELNELPNNIYEAGIKKFKIQVQFNENTYWMIWLNVSDPITEDNLPRINITHASKPNDVFVLMADLSFWIDTKTKYLYVSTDRIFEKANFNKKYPLNENSDQIISLLKQAFEYQVLITER